MSPLGAESSVDAHAGPGSAIAAVGNSSKALAKTKAIGTANLADRGTRRINIFAPSQKPPLVLLVMDQIADIV